MREILLIALITITGLCDALLLGGTSPCATEVVDLVEVNHYYDEAGKHVFDQLIFYDWVCDEQRYHVIAWRLLKQPSQLPVATLTKRSAPREWTCTWLDGELLRRIRARQFRETWTQHDPELRERAHLPKDQRRELATPLGPPGRQGGTIFPAGVAPRLDTDFES